MQKVGTIYVVATPIGNLGDMTSRAIQTLQSVGLIAAEDTRHSGSLLKYFSIETKMTALHNFNEKQQSEKLLDKVQQGLDLAIISDAGTPLICDPGFSLIHEAQKLKISVVPIPGACALISALSAAGLSANRFIFEGFLPAKQTARINQLSQLTREQRTLVFYEAPHRILACLSDLQQVFGEDRFIVVAREITKKFETIRSGKIAEIIEWITADSKQQLGEFVLLLAGAEQVERGEAIDADAEKILKILLNELPIKQASKLTAEITGEKKNKLYSACLKMLDF